MANPILKITDGTDWVNLMAGKNGFNLSGWTPQVAGLKSGGVYAENIMTDNRQLVHAVFENVTETFGLVLHGDTQDRAIETAQSLRRLLQKAREFWTSSWQREPVWIEARAPNETNTRYALIHNWDTPSDNNPFTQPFFSCPGAIMDEFTLVIERGHWLSNPPGESTCVQISGSQDFREANAQVGGVQTGTFEPAAQLDCQYKAHDESSATCIVYGQYPHIEMGHSVGAPPVYLYDGSVRFPVTIPKNAHISSAVVKFIADDADAGSKEIHICALQENDAEQFFYDGSCDDWEDRSPYRTAEVSWTCGAIVHGTEYSTADISPVIQEMVDRSNWASGDAMMLLFENADDTASLKSFIGYGDAVHHDPQLYVEWTVPSDATYGQTETCTEDVVFVANKHNRANISHLYRYDASITTYSGNLIQGAEGLPYQLLPTTPAAGDCLYVGIDYYLGNSGPFCNVIFDIGTAATGVYGHWEYWNGAWTTLSVRDEMRNYLGAGFTATGVKGVFFNQMSDWGTININGVIAFWIRYYVDSVASPTHAHQQNRNPYTVVWPFVDIAEDEITGDLSALIKVNVHNRSDVSTDANLQLSAGRIMMALRSCDRGEDFTPYINLNSNWMYGQNQFGIWCLIQDIVNVTCPVTILSPTGRAFMYAPSDAASPTSLTLSFSVVFEGDRLTSFTSVFCK